MHMQQAFNGNKNYVDYKHTEALVDTVLSLPMHPYMTQEDIDKVVGVVKKYI